MGNCSVCHAQTWLEIPSGRKLEMDKKTPHVCKQQNNAVQAQASQIQTVQDRTKRI
jgi:hypothetical protein